MDSSMNTVNSAIGLVFLILITASNVHAEKSLREKFRTGDTSSSSSEQSLKERFQTQDLTITPEYRVLSQKEAWESITPAMDMVKTWKLLTADTSDLFQCGYYPRMIIKSEIQPSSWLREKTYKQCDASGLGGVCYIFGQRSNNNAFRYIFDRKNNQINMIGQYDVKRGDLLLGARKRSLNVNGERLPSVIAYSENRGLNNPFPSLRSVTGCELYPLDNKLYCLRTGDVEQIECIQISKMPLLEKLQEYAASFNKSRAVVECMSYNVNNNRFQHDCMRHTWKNFVDGN
jgi:hypothetical protein